MQLFVGYGYNERDRWIDTQLCAALKSVGFVVVDGKDMHGEKLEAGVQARLERSDAIVSFFTLRAGQENAEFSSHIWVRDELVHAVAVKKPAIVVVENGVKLPQGLLGNLQYIALDQEDRLACLVELLGALGRRNIRRLRLEPDSDELRRSLHKWQREGALVVQFQTRDDDDNMSASHVVRLDQVDHAFYVNAFDVPRKAMVDVKGYVNGAVQFASGWVSADAVHVKVS